MSGKSIYEVWPDRPPVCAGCGREVDPEHSWLSRAFRLYCKLCAPAAKKAQRATEQEEHEAAAMNG